MRVAHVANVDLAVRFLLLDQLKAISAAGYDVTAVSAPGPWIEEVRAAGIPHIAWRSSSRSWGLRTDLRSAVELARILRRGRFDIVHTHTPKPGVIGRLVARAVGVPVVVNTVHGYYVAPADRLVKRAPFMALETIAALASDLELFVNREDLVWARRIAPLTRRRLLGETIDMARFDPRQVDSSRIQALREQLGIPPDAFVVGTMARFEAKKGLREFFAAARQIRATADDVYFLAVGERDPAKRGAISEAELEAARSHAIVVGWQADPREFLALMDVFVLASWIEGKGRVAMEAAALAKPVVLTDVRGCREIGRDGVDALMIPPRDAGALVAALARLRSDAALRSRLGQAARARAVAQFDQRPMFELMLREYRRALRLKGVGQPLEGEVRIRPGSPDDAAELAQLHANSIPHGFMTRLGARFLRVFYRALLTDPDGVCLVSECAGAVVGGLCSVTSRSGFYRRLLLRHGFAAAVTTAPKLIKPEVVRGVLENLRYAQNGSGTPQAEMISLAVDPEFRRRAVGRQLMSASLAELARRGVGEVMLQTETENEAAQRLFTAAGFRTRTRFRLHAGQESTIMVTTCRS